MSLLDVVDAQCRVTLFPSACRWLNHHFFIVGGFLGFVIGYVVAKRGGSR